MTDLKHVLVSIIVPFYNTQKYIRKCLLSITNQTYKEIEIILVDDGSTDKSRTVCIEFEKIDPRIRVISGRKTGVSEARNIGIRASNGIYLCFVDSDDWLSKYAIEKMVNRMETEKADFCYANYVRIEVLHSSKKRIDYKKSYCELTNYTDFVSILKQMGFGPCWKLYKMDIIKQNNIEFPVEISLGEDQVFNLQYLQYCHRIALEESSVYFYNRLNNSSVTMSMHLDINQWLFVLAESFERLFSEHLNELIVQEYLLKRYIDICYNACNHYVAFQKEIGANVVSQKINETILLFKDYLFQYEKSDMDKTYEKWNILYKYKQDKDLYSLKRKLQERNYVVNQPIWKKKAVRILASVKMIYFYKVTISYFDYQV